MTGQGRSNHILASILAVIAILVSPLLVCACNHHPKPIQEKTETPSCHKQAHDDDTGKATVASGADATCDCVMQATASKFIVKNDNTKPLKHIAAAEKISFDRRPVIVENVSIKDCDFYPPPLFAPDRHLNLSPGRAPPRL